MANVIIVHGTKGNAEENWFPWLKQQLEKKGCNVHVPTFPTPTGQSLDHWMRVFDHYRQYLDSKTILIGHSVGPAFLLNVLETLEEPVKACFFIAGFTGLLGNDGFDDLNRTFVAKDFDWGTIKENCNKFYVLNGADDPYVPIERGVALAKRLGTEVITIDKGGHLNAESGFKTFPRLLELVEKEL